MTTHHAVVLVDHHCAKVIQFGMKNMHTCKLQEQLHLTRQHASAQRSRDDFFSKVAAAFEGVQEVLVVGGHISLSDFRSYLQQHRPDAASRVVAYELEDHPTDPQLVALARRWFVRFDQMAGVPA